MVQQKLVEQDLQLAKQVQQAFLPKVTPDAAGYNFYQYYQAANQIGGDYFDYIQLAEIASPSSWPTWWGMVWPRPCSWPSYRPKPFCFR